MLSYRVRKITLLDAAVVGSGREFDLRLRLRPVEVEVDKGTEISVPPAQDNERVLIGRCERSLSSFSIFLFMCDVSCSFPILCTELVITARRTFIDNMCLFCRKRLRFIEVL